MKKKIGRPEKIDELTLAKLEEVFALGGTDIEACLYAGIHPATLYRYQKENEEFCERKTVLKESHILWARKSVIDHLKDDGYLALKYLERKKKDEFSTKTEITLEEPLSFTFVPPKGMEETSLPESQN